jgi:hypothetical protein
MLVETFALSLTARLAQAYATEPPSSTLLAGSRPRLIRG